MDGVTLDIEGIPQLAMKLQALAVALQTTIADGAIGAAAAILEPAIAREAPQGRTHDLGRSVGMARKNYNLGQLAIGFVGPQRPLGRIAPIVIGGTVERTTKSGRRTGKVTPNPFVERATASKSSEAMTAIENVIAQGIEQEAGK